jgi:hypothetical protein
MNKYEFRSNKIMKTSKNKTVITVSRVVSESVWNIKDLKTNKKTEVKYMKTMWITPKYAKYDDRILIYIKSIETKQVLKAYAK